MTVLLILSAALTSSISSYVDKIIMNKGISRRDYFFYMCLTMLPFALLMMLFETNRFEISLVPLSLLAFSAFIRYHSQISVVGILRNLEPFQYKTYVTLTIVLTYFIDNFLGTQTLSFKSILSIVLTITGVLLISNFKLHTKSLNKDIIIRILCGIVQGYITFFILKYWSNAVYIFVLNLTLTAVFSPQYTLNYHKQMKSTLKWIFLQQTFGFMSLYIINMLIAHSVTLSIYVTPATVVFSLLLAYFLHDKNRHPKSKDWIAIILVAAGLIILKL